MRPGPSVGNWSGDTGRTAAAHGGLGCIEIDSGKTAAGDFGKDSDSRSLMNTVLISLI